MSAAEENGRDHQPHVDVAGDQSQLTLQISAENDLLHKSCDAAQKNPDHDRAPTLGSQHVRELLRFLGLRRAGKTQHVAQGAQHNKGDDPEAERNAHVNEEVLRRLPSSANQFAQGHALESNSNPDEKKHESFEHHSLYILRDQEFLRCRMGKGRRRGRSGR